MSFNVIYFGYLYKGSILQPGTKFKQLGNRALFPKIGKGPQPCSFFFLKIQAQFKKNKLRKGRQTSKKDH